MSDQEPLSKHDAIPDNGGIQHVPRKNISNWVWIVAGGLIGFTILILILSSVGICEQKLCGMFKFLNGNMPFETTADRPTPMTAVNPSETVSVKTTSPVSDTPAPVSTSTPEIGATRISEKDGMTLVYVPAGEFEMGSGTNVLAWPIHTVNLDAFWIDRIEVTNHMFESFVTETGYITEAEKLGYSYLYQADEAIWLERNGADWLHPQGPNSSIAGLEDHPVVHVTWNDAKAYCEWADRRLPTEAEWEKAARGTDGRTYPWGESEPDGSLLNYADVNLDSVDSNKSVDDSYEYTSPVGSYPTGASPYGALDLSGNVWEWVWDRYGRNYYENSPSSNPTGPSSGTSRVQRGGSWLSNRDAVSSSARQAVDPEVSNQSAGFRCVMAEPLVEPTLEVKATKTPMEPTLEHTSTTELAPTPRNTIRLTQVPTRTPASGEVEKKVSPKDGMILLLVPAGDFEMGSRYQEDERPFHTVYLDTFWIDQTEVTNQMFEQFVSETGYTTTAQEMGYAFVYQTDDAIWTPMDGADWLHPQGPESNIVGLEDHPVVHVSWYDANEYCEWAGRRLPTEAEWEKAAHDTNQRFPWGNVDPTGNLLNLADVNLNSPESILMVDDGYEFTSPVGSYPDGASPYGALDMSGNVWEWVWDWYGINYYVDSPYSNPLGPSSGTSRVQRGGSWSRGGLEVRSANRQSMEPEIADQNAGFRCVLSD